MLCEQTQELLASYHQDELDNRVRERVSQHLAGCPGCRGESDEIHEVLSLFSSAGEFEPPAEVWQRIEAEISRPMPQLAAPASRRPAWSPLLLAIAATAAAVLLLGWLLDGLLRPRPVAEARVLAGTLEHRTAGGDRKIGPGGRLALWPGDRLLSTGEQRVRLELGGQKTRLTLDRRTALRFEHRLIELGRGRIHLREQGGVDWSIRTPHLGLRLIGTEVDVEVFNGATRLKVLAGQVELRAGRSTLRLEGGQQLAAGPGGEVTARAVSRFNLDQARTYWSALVGTLQAVKGAGGKLELHFVLHNSSAMPVTLASGAGRYCQLRVNRDGRQQPAFRVPPIRDGGPVQLQPGQRHVYRFDGSSLGRAGEYEVQGVYQVGGSPGLYVVTPPVRFRVP